MVETFILQWHLSEICNLKCKHCYQENHKPILLSKETLFNILEQYKELLKKENKKGHINLTGGEPLCCPYFFDILDKFKEDKELYTFSILTNGTLLTKELAHKIASYHPSYVQVSLEGTKKTNDYIRGKGTYQKIKEAIKLLKEENIYVSLSFTATKLNYQELPKVVAFANKNKVDTIWSDRYIPLSKTDLDLVMSKEETKEYLTILNNERIKLKNKNSLTTVACFRALQFIKANELPYHCTAGISLLTVMENGDLVPCRRMPIIVGNLLKDNMYNLYKNNKTLKDLQKNNIPSKCQKCEFSKNCRGGLKCLTYAVLHDYNEKDIGCFFE